MAEPLLLFLADLFKQNGGQISFERFMKEALYHPYFGYYTAQISSVGGSKGDFTTAAELSSQLANAISAWAFEADAASHSLQKSKPLHFIEMGCGNGTLAHDIFQSWSWLQRRQIQYHLVEVSPVLRDLQQNKLRRWHKRCHWHSNIQSALKAAQGRALIFSNELIDAFPAIVLRWNEATQNWEEIHLTFDPESGLQEVFIPIEKERYTKLKHWHSSLDPIQAGKPKNGDRIELHHSVMNWMQQWVKHLQQGAILSIDYGSSVGSIYHRRPEGSLRAYYRQQRLTGSAIYKRFGKQDLTADVNFTDLENWGLRFGLKTARREPLMDFTQRHLPRNKNTNPGHSLTTSASINCPQGGGTAFQTLIQYKP